MADFWLRWTVRLALACYAWRLLEYGNSLPFWRARTGSPSAIGSEQPFLSRLLWLLGSLLLLAHTLIAFGATHGWSHAAAYQHTAEQTKAFTGLDWGGGLYLNELTVALWLGDALWGMFAPSNYVRRSPWIGGALHVWLLFMAVNGAIVFATGPTRWVSAVVLAGVIIYVAAKARH
jgi:hypothetical protein